MVNFNKALVFIFMLLLVAGCGQNRQKGWHENAIKHYLQQNHPEMTAYKPVLFEMIDENFLMNNPEVSFHFNNLRRLFAGKEEVVKKILFQNSENLPTAADLEQLPPLQLDTLSRYIFYFAKIDNELHENSGFQEDDHLKISTEIEEETEKLNKVLSTYNLSVFNLDFEKMDSVFVYHKYSATAPSGENIIKEAVFEVDKDTYETLFEKELNRVDRLIR